MFQSVLDFIEKPEIIIVDNNSTDESIKYASLFLEDPNLDKKIVITQNKIFKNSKLLLVEQLILV